MDELYGGLHSPYDYADGAFMSSEELYGGLHSAYDHADKVLMSPEELYGGLHSAYDHADKALMSPEILIPTEYSNHNQPSFSDQYVFPPLLESEFVADNLFNSTVPFEAASMIPEIQRKGLYIHDDEEGHNLIKAKVASHPSYPKLLDAYIDCQKVGAPPEVASLLDEIKREYLSKLGDTITNCFGADPELDMFMENYCDIMVKYKLDLLGPFNEANSFFNKIGSQLRNLCKDDDNDEFSAADTEVEDHMHMKNEDRQVKERLLLKYGGSHISNLKHAFARRKKIEKLPRQASQTLLQWWNTHYSWPYPSEADKISLVELTGLDHKQVNNWFVNQRKRHWRPMQNMHAAAEIDNLSDE